MKFSFKTLVLCAVILWISALAMFVIGIWVPHLSILRWAAIPDAVLASVFMAMAAQNWAGGSK